MQLATASFHDPRALAKTADALWQAMGQPSVVFAADNRSSPTLDNRATRNARPIATDRATDICLLYHRRFGNAARKCSPGDTGGNTVHSRFRKTVRDLAPVPSIQLDTKPSFVPSTLSHSACVFVRRDIHRPHHITSDPISGVAQS